MAKLNKKTVCLLCLLFSLIFTLQFVFASEDSNYNKADFKISLNNYENIDGIEFSIYKIGDLTDNKIILSKDFSKYPVDLSSKNLDELNEYALTLKSYAYKDNLNPIYRGKTINKELHVNLDRGVYLVIGENLINGDNIYRTNPFILLIDGEKSKEIKSEPKFSTEININKYKNIDVVKIWDDKGYEKSRPDNIEISLLENKNVVASAKLNQANNWKHTFTNLNPKASYMVLENNVNKNLYNVKIDNISNSYTITNIKKIDNPVEKPEDTPQEKPKEKPEDTPQDKPDNKPEDKPNEEKIPQTGQSWTAIYVFLAVGILSIVIGLAKEKKRRNTNEK